MVLKCQFLSLNFFCEKYWKALLVKEIFVVGQVSYFKNHFFILFLTFGINSFSFGQEDIKNLALSFERLHRLKHASIVFASQNLNSPISSFGHTLLIFHNELTPEPDSLVFEYLGTGQVKFFAMKALLSSVEGSFKLRLWSGKFWEYEREDRDIWVIPLELKINERKKLNKRIKELLKEKPPYNFFFKNCSWYIFEILKASMKSMECSPKFYVLPIDTLRALNKCERLGGPIYLPSGATRSTQSFKKLNAQEREIFLAIKSSKQYNTLYEKTNHSIKEAMTEWIDYTIPRSDDVDTRNRLFNLKKYYHFPGKYYKKLQGIHTSKNGRITLLKEKNSATLTFSPAQMRFLGIVDDAFWADRFEVMTTSLKFKSQKLFISNWGLVDISTNTSANIAKFPFAKKFYLGYKRYSPDSTNHIERFSSLAGGGVSYNVVENWKLAATIFMETGIMKREKKNFFVRPGFSGGTFIRFLDWMRFKIELSQTLKSLSLINQEASLQFVFYEHKSLVMSLDYLTFSTVDNSQKYNSGGVSLSYLF